MQYLVKVVDKQLNRLEGIFFLIDFDDLREVLFLYEKMSSSVQRRYTIPYTEIDSVNVEIILDEVKNENN